MTLAITNPWLSVDRDHEANEAYLDSVAYLAETAYDEVLKQIDEAIDVDIDYTKGILVKTTVGNIEIDIESVFTYEENLANDFGAVLNEDKLWEIVYEATEAYIKRGEDV